jgi:hypothetical protein
LSGAAIGLALGCIFSRNLKQMDVAGVIG